MPLMVSGTLVDQSGRTLSGQTTEAFYVSIRHCNPFCVGLNCALGAKQMRPFVQRLSKVAECYVHVYSNAGEWAASPSSSLPAADRSLAAPRRQACPTPWAATTTRPTTWPATTWCSRGSTWST